MEYEQNEVGFDSDFDVMSLYQPKDLPKYGQRVTLGSQDIPEHLKRKKKNKNEYEAEAGRQTCQPDFAGQLQGEGDEESEVHVEEYREIERVKDIHKYQKSQQQRTGGPLVKEKDAFKVPDIMIKGTKQMQSSQHLNQITHFKKFKLTETDKNSISKVSTFSIDSNSSTLSLRLIGKGSFTDKQKQHLPQIVKDVIAQHHEAEEDDMDDSDDGEATLKSMKLEKAISYERLKRGQRKK